MIASIDPVAVRHEVRWRIEEELDRWQRQTGRRVSGPVAQSISRRILQALEPEVQDALLTSLLQEFVSDAAEDVRHSRRRAKLRTPPRFTAAG